MKTLPLALLLAFSLPLATSNVIAADAAGEAISRTLEVTKTGAVGDGKTLNTKTIQIAIDRLSSQGGGTLVVPEGVFVSGALFFKPGVNLRLDKSAVLQCSTDMANFPRQRTRIEGHFEDFNPALINADACNGFQITGDGTLDGAGFPIWEQFWKSIKANKHFMNLDLPRARLCLIENSKNVTIDGITFKDSQFWNLHLYKDQGVTVRNSRFHVPDDYKKAPSTDGIDVDSSQNVTIIGCYFSVTDDCIAMKGSKGPLAFQDKDSPPVEHVRISDCTFKRGNGVYTCGSEATIVRDVVAENCKVTGHMPVANLKLRSDTPQTYENLHWRNITLDSKAGNIIECQPWKQYFDLKGQQPPHSTVRNVTITNVTGCFGALGKIVGNPGQTKIEDITLENIDVQLKSDKFSVSKEVKNLGFKNVTVNGKSLGPTGQ
ncbi:MAG: glycoside hydrolase family 28 protein [Chthoniobacteraceae bacterium]